MSWQSVAAVAATLVGVLVISQLAFRTESSPSLRWTWSNFNPLRPLFLSTITLLLVFYGMRKHGEKIARLMVSGIIFVGMISTLVLVRFLTEPYGGVPNPFLLLLAPSGYLGLYWAVRYYTGKLSARAGSWLTAASAGAIGGLSSRLLPLPFTLVMLACLSLLDMAIVETKLLRRTLTPEGYSSLATATIFPLEKLGVGIGDILAYSILGGSVFFNFGPYLGAETAVLILFGAALTALIAQSRLQVAGLPIPLWLGSLPVVFKIVIP